MKIFKNNPIEDGFFMPAEYEEHEATIMIWPERPGSWPYGAVEARNAFADVIRNIAFGEKVYLACNSESTYLDAKDRFLGEDNIEVISIPSNDAWARDVAPTFLINEKRELRAVNWEFNAWGGEVDGLYKDYEEDNAFAKNIAKHLEVDVYDASPFVLEGGSIHVDSCGNLMTTKACLLSKGRNPYLTQKEIEERLKNYTGAKKIIWLPNGIYMDETNEHIDNMCAFIGPNEAVLAWCEDKLDEQYPMSEKSLEALEEAGIKVHKLPVPKKHVCVLQEELEGYVFAEGEDMRGAGERLAASYVNFYFANECVLVPQFGGDNEESDKEAIRILSELITDRRVVGIDAKAILLGGGNIHCITQQIPRRKV